MKTLLSIDGGGALGIGPAEFLSHAEREIGEIRSVDAYAGSSVGALLVALKATGKTWREVRDIFIKECPKIFAKPSLQWRMNPWKPKYNNKNLKEVALKYFGRCGVESSITGPLYMCDLEKPVFITAFDFATGKPKIFDRTDKVPVWWAVMCSAAAPTYFPIIDNRFGDGGLVANNPSMVGLAACVRQLGWDMYDIKCLSLGTNGHKWDNPKVNNITKIGWLKPLLNTYFEGGEARDSYYCQAMLGGNHLRIEPTLQHEIEMDDYEEALTAYRNIWLELWHDDGVMVKNWFSK
jgi:patatin-like phospholipase/acyl hydrolase